MLRSSRPVPAVLPALAFVLLASQALSAQNLATARPVGADSGTSAESPQRAGAEQGQPQDAAWTKQLQWRPVGPANMGGRMVDIAVAADDSSTWWIATASGGLLKTTNNGGSFEHQFDQEDVVAIGAIDVAPSDHNIVWVGTGENNPRNSVSYGNGVYKSVDGGETWEHKGLPESFQIGDIIIHPKDPNTVLVGALGRLYGPNEERGLYRTTDGGDSWEKILHVNDDTGIIDICVHPEDPDTMLVATFQRQRDGFDGNPPAIKIAPGSGLHRTTDGGATFEEVTEGLPSCNKGRIGLDWYEKDPNVVFAIIESEKIGQPGDTQGWWGFNADDAGAGAKITAVEKGEAADSAGLKADDIITAIGDSEVLTADEAIRAMAQFDTGDTVTVAYVRDAKKQTTEFELGPWPGRKPAEEEEDESEGEEGEEEAEEATPPRRRTVQPPRFGEFLGGQPANRQHLQGQSGHEHGGVYRSDDAGVTWKRINSINPRPMYFSHIAVDPSDDQHIFVCGVSMSRSKDGGETFTGDASRGVHSDQHALWIDPNDGRHIICASDGGLYVTWDRADTWEHINTADLGQFYHVAVGPRRDYWVYGGLQDNGTWGAPHRGTRGNGAVNEDWLRIGGGDGFIVQVDRNDPDQIYYESQNGSMGRTHLRTMEGGRMSPRPPEGEQRRFNWKTPFILSNHNSRIYYCAGNFVYRSLDRGNDLKCISPEITLTDRGSATALSESPRDPDVLYVGTDDGALWGTVDGGANWTDLGQFSAGSHGHGDDDITEGDEEDEENDGSDKGMVVSLDDVTNGQVNGEGHGDGEHAHHAHGLAHLVPGPRWVSSLEASRYKDGRAYVTLDGHRSDDDNPYVFTTEDFGATWTDITANLPRGSTRCVREDIENENLLYVGTEFGIYASLDRGQTWTPIDNNLPTVAVHDVAQHATSGEIVAGTHGRSLWILDVTAMRQMTDKVLASDAHLFAPNDVVVWQRRHGQGRSGGSQNFTGARGPSGAEVFVHLGKNARSAALRITDAGGDTLAEMEVPTAKGLHRMSWNLRRSTGGNQGGNQRGRRRGFQALPTGTYYAVLTVDGSDYRQSFEILRDPGAPMDANAAFDTSDLEVEEDGDGDR